MFSDVQFYLETISTDMTFLLYSCDYPYGKDSKVNTFWKVWYDVPFHCKPIFANMTYFTLFM